MDGGLAVKVFGECGRLLVYGVVHGDNSGGSMMLSCLMLVVFLLVILLSSLRTGISSLLGGSILDQPSPIPHSLVYRTVDIAAQRSQSVWQLRLDVYLSRVVHPVVLHAAHERLCLLTWRSGMTALAPARAVAPLLGS